MTAVSIQLQADVEAKAKELYAIARGAFCYAAPHTPDGRLFDQSVQGSLLLKAMQRIAAHILEGGK